MNETMKKYASFLLNEKLDEFCHFQNDLLTKYDLEIMKQFEDIPEEVRLEMSRKDQSEFLQSIIEDKADERMRENLNKWEANEIEEIDNQALGEVEIDAFLGVQKHALVKFLSDFSSNPIEISTLCQMIVEFYGVIERESYKSFARIKNNALEEVKALSEELSLKNEEIISSIRSASAIQSLLMGQEAQISNDKVDGFLLHKPKDIVSGDFFWMHRFKNAVMYCVGDCTGHGVPGALLTAVSLGLLQRAVIDNLTHPAEILNFLHQEYRTKFKGDQAGNESIDMTLCLLNYETNEFVFSGACNPIYIENRKGEFLEYRTSRKSIGSTVFDTDYVDEVLVLSDISKIYMQSDGYRDQIGGPKIKTLKRKNYRALLEKNSGKSMRDQKNELIKFLAEWRGNIEQIDDICILGLELKS